MKMKRSLFALALAGATIFTSTPTLEACSRMVYLGPENTVITSRSMDWVTDLGSNIWTFPRGMERNGAAGSRSIKWTSKYGSVVASAFEAATADGINEKGLVANILYLSESQYPDPNRDGNRPLMSLSAWGQYVLDMFATVDEAVEALAKEPFDVVTLETPDGKPGTVHLAISDASGDSAIFEYIDGKLIIHHNREYQVMTNSPAFDKQLALNKYWQDIGGTTFLPGTNRAADRFVRASFYINAITQTANINEAIAASFSVIRNVSVPIGISTPGQPNIASTLWRSVSDQKNKRYFFETTRHPNVFWISLDKVDFTAGKPAQRLAINSEMNYAGEASKDLKPTKPFEFLQPPGLK